MPPTEPQETESQPNLLPTRLGGQRRPELPARLQAADAREACAHVSAGRVAAARRPA